MSTVDPGTYHQMGWQCPLCRRVFSPHVTYCTFCVPFTWPTPQPDSTSNPRPEWVPPTSVPKPDWYGAPIKYFYSDPGVLMCKTGDDACL